MNKADGYSYCSQGAVKCAKKLFTFFLGSQT